MASDDGSADIPTVKVHTPPNWLQIMAATLFMGGGGALGAWQGSAAALHSHETMTGHPVLVDRVNRNTKTLDELRQEMDDLSDEIGDTLRNTHLICAKLDVQCK